MADPIVVTSFFTLQDFKELINGEKIVLPEWVTRHRFPDVREKYQALFNKYPALLGYQGDWLVIKNAKCFDYIDLQEIKQPGLLSILFYSCVIPAIVLNKVTCAGWNIVFVGSSSGEGMVLENGCHFGFLHWLDSSQGGQISIRQSRCEGINLLGNSEAGGISVDQSSQTGRIMLTDRSSVGLILIRGTCLVEGVDISQESWAERIVLRSECYLPRITIVGGSSGNISVYERSQLDRLDVVRSKTGSLNIDRGGFCNNILLRSESKTQNITVVGTNNIFNLEIDSSVVERVFVSNVYGSIDLQNAFCQFIRYDHCQLHRVSIQAGTKGEFYFEDSRINHLALYKTAILKDAVLSIVNSELHVIQFQELLVQGQLILRNIKAMFEEIHFRPERHPITRIFEDVQAGSLKGDIFVRLNRASEQISEKNESEIQEFLKQFSLGALFRVVDSSLGKTEITGSQLQGFRFEYRDSKLLEVFIAGTKIARERVNIYVRDVTQPLYGAEFYRQKVSIYNQLKRIFENQGDIVETTWYHAKAMENQEKLLQLNYGGVPRKWYSEPGFDLLSFRLNKISNNHGESWRRALIFLLVTSFVMYLAYYGSINYYRPFSWSGTGVLMGDYFSFLDITHKSDFLVPRERQTAISKFLDFFGRVIIGYGIYQFIAAFRRHGRKGA